MVKDLNSLWPEWHGSEKVDSKLVDVVVKSIDDSVEVELCSVKTVVKSGCL